MQGKNTNTNFGAALAETRKESGLTLQEMFLSTDIPSATVRQYERSPEWPDIDEIVSISKAFEVSPFDLLRRSWA